MDTIGSLLVCFIMIFLYTLRGRNKLFDCLIYPICKHLEGGGVFCLSVYLFNYSFLYTSILVVNRPGVARAVLHTPFLLVD